MGMTTVVEIDHDFAGEIIRHLTAGDDRVTSPELIYALEERMSTGAGESPIQGVKFVTTFHRGGQGTDRAWEGFKNGLVGGFADYQHEFLRAAMFLDALRDGDLDDGDWQEINELIERANP